MLELTKKRTTDGFVDFSLRVPEAHAAKIAEALRSLLALLPEAEPEPGERLYSLEEAFPDSHPGRVLRGARRLGELTQAELAALIGVRRSHISEMETGKRPIGKAMAKRLAKALGTSFKVFL
jgi:DNA-binding XRE family transcriptional regulator